MAVNPLIVNNFIDTCAFDPKYEPETTASLEILKLSDYMLSKDGRCLVLIAHSTQDEIDHPNTPAWVKKRAEWLLYTIEVPLSPDEKTLLGNIEMILAGRGRVDSIKQDARHVFEAQKYGGYFITTDNRVLSRAEVLHDRYHVIVLKPSKFLALVQEYKAGEQVSK
jgi:hypothetical protein